MGLIAFQSTRPVRGGTENVKKEKDIFTEISIHPPRAGRDAWRWIRRFRICWISIHPPRAGRDKKRR